MLGFGRAIGETIAVTMVIGNNPQASLSLFAPQYSMAAVIAKSTSYLPMEYADRLARISYATDVRMVDELMAELNPAPATGSEIKFPPPPANENERNGG